MFLRNSATHLLENHKPAKHRKNTCKTKKTVWDSLKEILEVCDFLEGAFLLENECSLEIPPDTCYKITNLQNTGKNTCKNKKTAWDSLEEIFKVELEGLSQSL